MHEGKGVGFKAELQTYGKGPRKEDSGLCWVLFTVTGLGRLDTLWVTMISSYTLTPPEGADHTRAIILGCIGGIVAVGLGLVLAYRLSVEIYDRREYSRFEKERQQLNWKQVRPGPIATGSPTKGPPAA